MSETKHTKGPWHAHIEVSPTTGGVWVATVDGEANVICDVIGRKGANAWTEEDHANAELIAAAPDMLAAIKDFLDRASRGVIYTDGLRAAIAKAEGK